MLVFIILFCLFAFAISLLIASGFYESMRKQYVYNPHGKETSYIYNTRFKNETQKRTVIDEIKDKYRKNHNLAADTDVSDSMINYERVPSVCKAEIIHSKDIDLDTARGMIGLLVGIFSFVGLVVCGIPCFVNHTQVNQQERSTELMVRADDLHDRQNVICMTLAGELGIKVQDSGTYYHVIVDAPVQIASSINTYNSDVKSFKQFIYLEKVRNESPWINWFVNPGFEKVEGYNPNATSYKDILGDTLKTFELTNKK